MKKLHLFILIFIALFAVFNKASALTDSNGDIYCEKENYWELVTTGTKTGSASGDTGFVGYDTLVPEHLSNNYSYDVLGTTAGATLRLHQRVVGPDPISPSQWESSWGTRDCTTSATDGNRCTVYSEGFFWVVGDPSTCELTTGGAYSPPNNINSDPILSGSCSGTPNPANTGQNVTWSSTAAGGNGTYSYSWSGTDGLSGTGSSVVKSYSTASIKDATVSITSGTQTVSANCSVEVQTTPPPPTVSGYHDGASGTVASTECKAFGWTTYSGDTSTDLYIRILSDGASVYYGYASGYRGDLTGVCSGGTCAFDVNLDGLISYDVNHTITAQAQNPSTSAWTTLGTSPKTLKCTAPPPPPPPPPAPTATLSASPNPTDYGGYSTLTWSSTNATSCSATWTSSTATSGTKLVGPLYSNTYYPITCTGSGGTANANTTVNVNPEVSGSGTIVVNSNLATTWSITGPANLTQSTSITSKTYTAQPTGTYTITPAPKSGYTYTISTASSQALSDGGTITFNITYTSTTGAIVVNSNLATTWSITGPANLTQSTDITTKTYTAQPTGTYTITPTAKSGYTVAVNTNPQTLSGGGTITFNITYTSVGTTGTIVVNSNLATTWSITGPANLTQSTDITTKTYTSQPVGTYTITPAPKSGYTYTVNTNPQTLSGGGTITFSITYTPASGTGTIVVNSNIATTWSVTNGSYTYNQTSATISRWIYASAGTYTITPAEIPGYAVSVNANPQNVFSGETTTFELTYTGPPNSLSISCPSSTLSGQATNFSAVGGTTSTYAWSATYSPSPATKTGDQYFTTVWGTGGITATVTVANGSEEVSCNIDVTASALDYTISVDPDPVYIQTGARYLWNQKVSITPYGGFSNPIYICPNNISGHLRIDPYRAFNTQIIPRPIQSPYTNGVTLNYQFNYPMTEGAYIVTVDASDVSGTCTTTGLIRTDTFTLIVNDEGAAPEKAKGIIPPFEEF